MIQQRASETERPSFWNGVKRHRKIARVQRRNALSKHLPAISDFCALNKIEMLTVQHGYQFRIREYVINWSPATNKVKIQYTLPGHGKTIDFSRNGQPNKPRILVALEELVQLVRSE